MRRLPPVLAVPSRNAVNRESALGNLQVTRVSCAFGETNPAASNKPRTCSRLACLKKGGQARRRTSGHESQRLNASAQIGGRSKPSLPPDLRQKPVSCWADSYDAIICCRVVTPLPLRE